MVQCFKGARKCYRESLRPQDGLGDDKYFKLNIKKQNLNIEKNIKKLKYLKIKAFENELRY